jgi:hypothetical protein
MERRSENLVAERNLLAHGCWTNHPVHGWLVRETRGAWGANNDGPRGSKKLMPEAKRRDQNKIQKTVSELDRLIEDMLAFKRSLHYST